MEEYNKAKIIDLVARMKEQEQKGGRKPGATSPTALRIAKFKAMAREAVREAAPERLTEQENTFADLIVNGGSMVEAYKQAFPERCYAVIQDCKHKQDEPCTEYCERLVETMTYEQCYSKANALSKKPDVRSTVILRLEQEEGDISHTASRLDNFIVKRLEAESQNPMNSAAARIAALKALSEHRAVAVAEGKAADKAAATSEEVLERISERVHQLTGGKKEL